MKALKCVLGIFALLAVSVLLSTSVMAFSVTNGTITVGASDLVPNQSSTDFWNENWSGYDYRFSYSTNANAYAQNGNFTSPVLSGWSSAVYQNNNCTLYNAGGGVTYVDRNDQWGSDTGSFIYKFDLSGTGDCISQLDLTNCSAVWTDGGQPTTVDWYVSTDGSTWSNYGTITATSAGGGFAGSANYYDVSSYVKGHNIFYVQCVFHPNWAAQCDEAFRSGGYGDWGTFDAKVWLSPIPSQTTAIGDAKAQADNTQEYVSGIVTASNSANNFFYIEDASRTSGLRVIGSANVGSSVVVGGTMTTVNGERALTSTLIDYAGKATVPAPLYLSNKALGGGSAAPTVGVDNGTGVNNFGLLVTTTGKITGVVSEGGGTVLTIDDGSGVGVKIAGVNGDWTTGATVTVTGISSVWTADGGRQRQIIPTAGLTTTGSAITVNSGDVDNGTFTLGYSVVTDAYTKNGTAFLTGWSNGAYSSNNFAHITQYDGSMYLGRESATSANFGGEFGSIVWKFDVTPSGLHVGDVVVYTNTSVWYDSNHNCSAKWSASADGVTWFDFNDITASTSNGSPFGSSPYYDVEDYDVDGVLIGSATLYIRAVVDPYWVNNMVELFRYQSAAPFFEVQISLQ